MIRPLVFVRFVLLKELYGCDVKKTLEGGKTVQEVRLEAPIGTQRGYTERLSTAPTRPYRSLTQGNVNWH